MNHQAEGNNRKAQQQNQKHRLSSVQMDRRDEDEDRKRDHRRSESNYSKNERKIKKKLKSSSKITFFLSYFFQPKPFAKRLFETDIIT